MNEPNQGEVRIGELSRRVGVSVDVLRAWERRYGVLRPARSESGQRLYSARDEARVRQMLGLVEGGYSPQVAARMLDAPDGGTGSAAEPVPQDSGALARALFASLAEYDGVTSHAAIDWALERYTLTTTLRDVLLPTLREIGDAWARGDLSVAQEHFAAALIGERLRGLARGWDAGRGPRVIVACAPGERHELGAMCFALALRQAGWRITWLGADVPADSLRDAADELSPELVVVVTLPTGTFDLEPLAQVSSRHTTAIGGGGVGPEEAQRLGARLLTGDPISAAAEIGAGV